MATVNVDTIKLHEEYKRETGYSRPDNMLLTKASYDYIEWLENKVNDLIENKDNGTQKFS